MRPGESVLDAPGADGPDDDQAGTARPGFGRGHAQQLLLATAPVHSHQLRTGDLVVLYTDGIVERREESLDQGFRRLAAVAEELVDLHVDELADALVEAMVPEDTQADDLAVLVVRVEASAGCG